MSRAVRIELSLRYVLLLLSALAVFGVAIGAGVPIVPAWIDRAKRMAAIGPAIMPTGNYRSDLKRLADFYRDAYPDNPRFKEIDRDVRDAPSLSKPEPNGLGDPP